MIVSTIAVHQVPSVRWRNITLIQERADLKHHTLAEIREIVTVAGDLLDQERVTECVYELTAVMSLWIALFLVGEQSAPTPLTDQ